MPLHTLNAQDILHSAAREAGLEDYIDSGIAERFAYMVGLLNAFDSLRDNEYLPAVQQLKEMAAMRLRVARDWALHPEILDEEITQPFFVIGNARAGTTFTQMLLAWDEGHRTPRYRDARHPSPPYGLDPAADAAALAAESAFVRFMLEKSPGMLPAHPYLDQGGNAEAEDEHVYSLDFDLVYPLHLLKVANLPWPRKRVQVWRRPPWPKGSWTQPKSRSRKFCPCWPRPSRKREPRTRRTPDSTHRSSPIWSATVCWWLTKTRALRPFWRRRTICCCKPQHRSTMRPSVARF